MNVLRSVNVYLLLLCRWALIVMIPVMTGIIFTQVVLRYIFFSPLSWAEELSKYLLVWVTCLGSACGIRESMHVSIDYVRNKVVALPQLLMTLLVFAAALTFFLFCIVLGVQYAYAGWFQRSAALQLPMTLPYLAIPVGFLIMLSVGIERFIDDLRYVRRNRVSPVR